MTKRKLKEKIEKLEERIIYLENMHATFAQKEEWTLPDKILTGHDWVDAGRVAWYRGRQLKGYQIRYETAHPQPRKVDFERISKVPPVKTDTERIKGVSFEELAQYVLDGKPIRRKRLEEVFYTTIYSPDSTIRLESTPKEKPSKEYN